MAPRILYLDGLRGVLAVIVFLHHFFYIYYPELIFGGDYASFSTSGTFGALKMFALTPISILYNPGFAIHFFFLLSGYVQTQSFYLNGNAASIQRSVLKRYFRLALPTLVVVLLVFCAHKFQFIHKEQIAANVLNADWLKSMLPNTLKVSQLFKEGLYSCFVHNSRYYQVLWTMPTELANSFLVLFLALALNNVKHQTKLTVALLLVQFFVLQEYYSIAFVSGMLIARLQVQETRFGVFFSKTWVKALCTALGLYFGSYPFTGYQGAVANSIYAPISFFETYPHIISYFIGSTFLFLFLLHAPNLQSLLSRKVFLFYGRISFMLYLLHFLLLLTIIPSIYQSTHSLAATLVLALALVTALSWLFTKFIDEPVIRFCNWWAGKFV
jgi:peptidoglycan/LPS O-acetylase OafA/YrhL